MAMDGSWLDSTICLLAAAAVAIAFRRGCAWALAGAAAVLSGALLGSAGWLLFPAGLGCGVMWAACRAGGGWRRLAFPIALAGVALAGFLCWAFPLPEIPPASGAHAVGTLTFELATDGDLPALLVNVWYPARPDDRAPRVRWLPEWADAPRFPFHRLGAALAGARTGLEPAAAPARFPVVFYEHSWTGHHAENVAQVEDLASHGFVVVAIDHPGQAARVRYADGRVAVTRLPGAFALATEQEVAEFENLAEQCVEKRIREVSRVKRALARATPAPLAGRLSLERLGVFGFSFGGTAAVRLCAVDPSFHAGVNEDGMMLGDLVPRGPFLFLGESVPGRFLTPPVPGESPEDAEDRRTEMRIRRAMEGPGRKRVILDGTLHPAFSDRIFTCRLPRLARTGTRPAVEIHPLVTREIATFFKRELTPPVAGSS